MTQSLAIVTGAASGIGAEVAQRLARRGYGVIAVDRTQELADQAATGLGGESIPVACNLSSASETKTLCQRIATEWPQGSGSSGLQCRGDCPRRRGKSHTRRNRSSTRCDPAQFHASHQCRLGVFLPRDRGHVMATVSLGGICPLPGSAPYSAAKAGLRAFLAALNCEVAGTGVRVSGIYPTAVNTPMLEGEARLGSALNFLSRVLTVNEVADAYERALDKPKLEIYVPYHESLSARAALWTPSLIPRLLPFFNRIGERGRAKYLNSLSRDDADPA